MCNSEMHQVRHIIITMLDNYNDFLIGVIEEEAILLRPWRLLQPAVMLEIQVFWEFIVVL